MTLDLGRLGKVSGTGSGVAMAGGTNGFINTLALTDGINVNGPVPVTDPESTLTVPTLTADLGTGTFQGIEAPMAPLMWNALPIPGMARFCLIAGACGPSPLINFTTSGIAGPAGIGLGGVVTSVGVGGMNVTTTVTLEANGWAISPTAPALVTSTPGGTFATTRGGGFVHGATSDTQIVLDQGRGTLQMITPTQVTVRSTTESAKVALFSTLTLRFIPEPGRLLAALTAVAAVASVAVIRRR